MESGSRVVKGANPTTVFNLVGPATVGVSSLSGMRMARWLDRELAGGVAFWPFDEERCGDAALVVTEIFPRLYYLRSGSRGDAWRRRLDFERVLAWYGAAGDSAVSSEDEGDAMVSASAIRALSGHASAWRAAESEREAAGLEGWIFGAGAAYSGE
jgi:hypothetical protein